MKIVGIENLSTAQIRDEVQRGGKFVYFQFCISVIIMTFRRPSEIHFVRSGESAVTKGLSYSLISFFVGWWGIPWGPIYTVGSLVSNFRGGKDVTEHVLANLQQHAV
ncbi:MAG: hypothetical protein J0I77_13025 [Rudaea sp.]|uniref:hypothetical protein n=1 Tax=unclassified Rudaea TaxID=2627037 RepID=UPI0010FA1620|nr:MULTISPECIES: hypothetical protein [unclassified Rudaea]MBN8886639.1 hypothetical protein [Rudaea sp.]MBR0346120.1 hypothetical protein [Rudaea sp.]